MYSVFSLPYFVVLLLWAEVMLCFTAFSVMDASTSSDGVYRLKVVLLGEGAVGKTSIVLQYVENKFTSKHFQTLQVGF